MKILLTGASSGIGAAIVKQLIEKNHHVIGLARDFSKLSLKSPRFIPYEVDLSNLKQLPKFLSTLSKEHPDVEALVLNAAQGLFGQIEQFSFDQIQSNFNLNLISHTYITKTFLPLMKASKQGTLIFMGSEAALQGKSQGSIYCASKFALRGFVQALRQECARSQIRVSLINPGPVKSPFFDRLHFIHGKKPENYCLPEEVAEFVVMQIESRTGFVLEEINLGPLKRVIETKPPS